MQTHQELAKGVTTGSFPSPISYNLIFLTASIDFSVIYHACNNFTKKDHPITINVEVRNGRNEYETECTKR